MQDMIIKGTGNSRYLKSVANAMNLYPTYEDFIAALVAGTFPVDFNGVNPSGVEQAGTALNKANLLTDATAALYGKGRNASPDDILAAIRPLITAAQSTADAKGYIQTGSYTGNGTAGPSNRNSISFSFAPKLVVVCGGGGAFYIAFFVNWQDGIAFKGPGVSPAGKSSTPSYRQQTTWNGNTLIWNYISGMNNDQDQLNANGEVYNYIAIG